MIAVTSWSFYIHLMISFMFVFGKVNVMCWQNRQGGGRGVTIVGVVAYGALLETVLCCWKVLHGGPWRTFADFWRTLWGYWSIADISLIIKIEMFILLIPLAEYFDFNGLHYNIMSVFSTQSRDYGVFFCPNAASPPCVYAYKIISSGLLTVLS